MESIMGIILSKLFCLYAFILLGYFLGKGKKELNEHTGILSFLAVSVFLPAKVFSSFSTYFTVSYIRNNYTMLLISLGLLLVMHFAGKLVAKLFRSKTEDKGVYEYTVVISNYGYLGYALMEGVFGPEALTDMILFCLPFSLYTYTVGYMKLTGGKVGIKRLLNPVTIASLAGMAFGLTGWTMPEMIDGVLSASSACLGPIAMLLTGLTLSEFSFKRMLGDAKAYGLTAVRLIAVPLFIYLAFTGLGFDALLPSALLMAAMPSGLNTIIFPKNLGRSPELGAKLALISHLASCITLPLWLILLQ